MDFQSHRDEFEAKGLKVVALTVDKPEDLPKAREMVEELGIRFTVGTAPPRLIEVLDTLQRVLVAKRRTLALPLSFLVDPQNRLAVIYKGAVSAESLFADLALLPLEGEELRRAATPFRGTSMSRGGAIPTVNPRPRG